MNKQDKEYLAAAYQSAWRTVKRDRVEISVLEHGWFLISCYPATRKCRASDLLKGLCVLNGRLERMHEKPEPMSDLEKKYPADFKNPA